MSIKSQSAAHGASTHEAIVPSQHEDEEVSLAEALYDQQRRERTVAWLRLLWARRSFLFRMGVCGFVLSTIIAFLIPSRYTSVARLMPPDSQSGSGLAMMAATLTGGSAGGLGEIAGDLLGVKSSSDLFVGILSSRTAEDALIQKFELKKVYRQQRMENTRQNLADHTNIDVDRKTQIITIAVTDSNPRRAAAMVQAYVEELDHLVAELSTSSARRERIFLEGRLQAVSQDLETAEKSFSQFASKNTAINVPEQGKAMVDAAAILQGQLIAAQSELEGLKQIYTDNNVRVRSITARVDELQHQLDKLAGKGEGTSDTSTSGQNGESMYPSIRKLPLLGVTYADLYRRTKVQEAVFESLTQEFELAKVQEAKEIPIVKVLDLPDIPEQKSYPPRSKFILLGTALAFLVGVTMIFSNAMWERVDAGDPGKKFAREIFSTVRARLPWVSSNGSGVGAIGGEVAGGLIERKDEIAGDK
jgi:capsule polysaccharide export protein KpsE/RkpR